MLNLILKWHINQLVATLITFKMIYDIFTIHLLYCNTIKYHMMRGTLFILTVFLSRGTVML
jgi:hypothetical protein